MKAVRLRSLQAKLALRLAALHIAATAIAVAVLIYQAYETADTLNDRELSLRAADFARHVAADSTGTARLELPPELAALYQAAGSTDIFAGRPRPGCCPCGLATELRRSCGQGADRDGRTK